MVLDRVNFLSMKQDGTVEVVGIEQPIGTLHDHWGNRIVVKVPGHSYWSGRGEQSYAGAEFQVYEILERNDNGRFKCKHLMDVPVRAKKDPAKLASQVLTINGKGFQKEAK